MTAVAALGRHLPRGWSDLARQLVIWFGFLLAYQVVRGFADRNPTKAFENGWKVIDLERNANALFEVSLQRLVHASDLLITLTSWTYWLSQFTVVGLGLLWVYLRRNDAFIRVRNAILLANVLGLVGYVLLPTAPPRMFERLGFVDTLAQFGGLNHGSGLIELASNPYAAMPSLHSADALIIGAALALLVRSWLLRAVWLLWPVWVWFSVIATGNHFWLDILAGVVVAVAAGAVVLAPWLRRRRSLPAAA